MMLDTFGILTVGATAAALLLVGPGSRTSTLWNRMAVGLLAGAWIGLVIALTASGAIDNLAIFFVVFLVSLILAPFFWRDVPSQTIVALNVLRLLGVLFLLLVQTGQLSGPFPYFAGIGDMITGGVALFIAFTIRGQNVNDGRLLAWNAFGLLDLFVAVFLGITSGNGTPLQVFHVGAGSAAISTLPWSLIPLVFVPLFLAGHVLIFMRAAARRTAAA
jgi:hypothetical protein